MSHQLPIFDDLKEVESFTIDFLREHEPRKGYYLGFSGGKDSLVLYHLARKADVKFYPYYSATRIDPPEIVRFIKKYYPDVTWKYPKRSFYSYLLQYGYPTRLNRWCCTSLKKAPTRYTIVPLKHRLFGVRAEESSSRAKFKDLFGKETCGTSPYTRHLICYKPIFYWRDWHVWEFIERNKLQYCELYDQGLNRCGCMVCPMICSKSMNRIKDSKRRWPSFYKVFEKVMLKLYSTHNNLEDTRKIMSFDEFLNRWYMGINIKKLD